MLDLIVDEYVSIGDYVLTGGEIPACVVVDCVSRLIDGVLPSSECYESESLTEGFLSIPSTRPPVFMGIPVPEVLLSGNHAKIDNWRRERAIEITRLMRPDLHFATGSVSAIINAAAKMIKQQSATTSRTLNKKHMN